MSTPPVLKRTPPPGLSSLAPGQLLSEASKTAIAEMALGLLEEQVQARIVHYKADLDTNPELDAITAQVVSQLKRMQQELHDKERPADSQDVAASQEQILTKLLRKQFPPSRPSLMVERKQRTILRSLAKLFFQSELHEKTRGNDGGVKVIQHGEQAIYYLLMRYRNRMANELAGFDYADDEVKQRSSDLLAKLTKDMQDSFLSRRSTELKRIVAAFNTVLLEFLTIQLPPAVPQLAHEVIHQAATFEGKSYGYKVGASAFPRFRTAFERRLMVRLVGYAEDQLVRRLADTAGDSRNQTLAFITDPQIFSMMCGELSDATYDYLCNEGFLDLPPDWRAGGPVPSTR